MPEYGSWYTGAFSPPGSARECSLTAASKCADCHKAASRRKCAAQIRG